MWFRSTLVTGNHGAISITPFYPKAAVVVVVLKNFNVHQNHPEGLLRPTPLEFLDSEVGCDNLHFQHVQDGYAAYLPIIENHCLKAKESFILQWLEQNHHLHHPFVAILSSPWPLSRPSSLPTTPIRQTRGLITTSNAITISTPSLPSIYQHHRYQHHHHHYHQQILVCPVLNFYFQSHFPWLFLVYMLLLYSQIISFPRGR